METFTMPLHEINERFTRSELFMVAWRSQEQHFNLKKRMKKYDKPGSNVGDRSRYGSTDIIPDELPESFYNDEGEIDLSKVTGNQARKYMANLGIPFPVIGQVGRM